MIYLHHSLLENTISRLIKINKSLTLGCNNISYALQFSLNVKKTANLPEKHKIKQLIYINQVKYVFYNIKTPTFSWAKSFPTHFRSYIVRTCLLSSLAYNQTRKTLCWTSSIDRSIDLNFRLSRKKTAWTYFEWSQRNRKESNVIRFIGEFSGR